jgi:tripeptide aminopeptidase
VLTQDASTAGARLPDTVDPRLVHLFLKLVRIDALSGGERPVAEAVRGWLEPLGFRVEEDGAGRETGGSCGNLLCFPPGVEAPEVALLAHMDTARPTRDLKPLVTEDRITSSGDTILGGDDRAGMAAILHAAERAVRQEIPCQPCVLAFTIREETDLGGSRRLRLPDSVTMAFVLDSSQRPGNFIHRTYGAQRFHATVEGRPAHAGVAPEKGIHALHAACRAIARLPQGRLDDRTTANVGVLESGSAVNVVPHRARVEGEVRSLDEGRVDEVIATIRQSFQDAVDAAGARLDFAAHWEFRPYDIAPASPVFQRIESVLAGLELTVQAVTSPGGSDANSLNAAGTPAVNIGIGAQNPHGDDEFILLEDLQAAADIALGLLRAGQHLDLATGTPTGEGP